MVICLQSSAAGIAQGRKKLDQSTGNTTERMNFFSLLIAYLIIYLCALNRKNFHYSHILSVVINVNLIWCFCFSFLDSLDCDSLLLLSPTSQSSTHLSPQGKLKKHKPGSSRLHFMSFLLSFKNLILHQRNFSNFSHLGF